MPARRDQASLQICRFRRHQHLVRAHEPLEAIFQIEEGWVSRYSLLASGRRQITAIYLPGDLCEPHWLLEDRSRESVIALTGVRARRIPIGTEAREGAQLVEARSLLAATRNLIHRQSQWIAALGRKSALERICAVLADLFERMRQIGRAPGNSCQMPLTQVDLADIVGLTPIHVNRVLKELRERRLVEMRDRCMVLPDPVRVHQIAAGNVSPGRAASLQG